VQRWFSNGFQSGNLVTICVWASLLLSCANVLAEEPLSLEGSLLKEEAPAQQGRLLRDEPLTLVESLLKAEQHSKSSTVAQVEQRIYNRKKAELEASKISTEIRGQLSNTRNEITDPSDATAAGTETLGYNVSYQQSYESGLVWAVRHYRRNSSPLDVLASKEQFNKAILTVDYPLYGPGTVRPKLTNEVKALKIEQQHAAKDDGDVEEQAQVAFAYIAACQSQFNLEESIKSLEIQDELFKIKSNNRMQSSPLALIKAELELKRQKAKMESAKREMDLSLRQLYDFFGDSVSKRPLECRSLVFSVPTEEELQRLFLERSLKLKQLDRQEALAIKEADLKGLDSKPEVLFTGYGGQTQSFSTKGNNMGATVTVVYRFGGGAEERQQLALDEMERISAERDRSKEQLELQASKELLRLNALEQDIKLTAEALELTTLQKQQTEEISRGQLPKAVMLEMELELIAVKKAHDKAIVAYWKQWIRSLANAGQDLSVQLSSAIEEG